MNLKPHLPGFAKGGEIKLALNSTGSSYSIYDDGGYIGLVGRIHPGKNSLYFGSALPRGCATGCSSKSGCRPGDTTPAPCSGAKRTIAPTPQECLQFVVEGHGYTRKLNPYQWPEAFLKGQAVKSSISFVPKGSKAWEFTESKDSRRQRRSEPRAAQAMRQEAPVPEAKPLTLEEQMNEAMKLAKEAFGDDGTATTD